MEDVKKAREGAEEEITVLKKREQDLLVEVEENKERIATLGL